MAQAGGRNISDGENAAACAQRLLDAGANIHMRDLWTGMMPLHYAALFNAPLVVEKLLSHKSQLGESSFLADVHVLSTSHSSECPSMSMHGTELNA